MAELMEKAIQIAYDELFEKKCEYASQAGFKSIAVNFTKVLDKTEYEWEKITEDIERILDETSLKCIQSHPYYYDLLVSSEITEQRLEFAMNMAIIASARLGASWCVFHPRSSITSGFCTSKSLEDNKKAFSTYLDTAVKHGTGIAAENLPIFGGIVPIMPFYSSNYDDLRTLVDSFNDKSMGICWDTGHANKMHMPQDEAIRYLGNRIKCTHIHNNFNRSDDHLPPDSGTIDWEKVISALADIGYSGPLTLETHCCYDDPELLKSFARHNYVCLQFIEKYANNRGEL